MFIFQVMEKAELLRETDANVLPALLRLQELVRQRSELFVLSIRRSTLLLLHCADDDGWMDGWMTLS